MANICADCLRTTGFCSWEQKPPRPVDGWTAELVPYSGGGVIYAVTACPMYKPRGNEKPKRRKIKEEKPMEERYPGMTWDPDRAVELRRGGLTRTEVAKEVGTSVQNMYSFFEKHPEKLDGVQIVEAHRGPKKMDRASTAPEEKKDPTKYLSANAIACIIHNAVRGECAAPISSLTGNPEHCACVEVIKRYSDEDLRESKMVIRLLEGEPK